MPTLTRAQFTDATQDLIERLEHRHWNDRSFRLAFSTGDDLSTLVSQLPIEDYEWAMQEADRLLQQSSHAPMHPSQCAEERSNTAA